MQNDDYEKFKDKESNHSENRKYGPEIKYETYTQFYFRKFMRDYIYFKVKSWFYK